MKWMTRKGTTILVQPFIQVLWRIGESEVLKELKVASHLELLSVHSISFPGEGWGVGCKLEYSLLCHLILAACAPHLSKGTIVTYLYSGLEAFEEAKGVRRKISACRAVLIYELLIAWSTIKDERVTCYPVFGLSMCD